MNETNSVMLDFIYKTKGFALIRKSYYETLEEGMKNSRTLDKNILKIGSKLSLLKEIFMALNEEFKKEEELEFLITELEDILQTARRLKKW